MYCGFCDLGEDSGELEHQLEARSAKKLAAIQDFAKREKSKSKREVLNSQPQVGSGKTRRDDAQREIVEGR
jgi:hypothetical protein